MSRKGRGCGRREEGGELEECVEVEGCGWRGGEENGGKIVERERGRRKTERVLGRRLDGVEGRI